MTLLHVAAAANQTEIVDYLTSGIHVISINTQDSRGNTALHTAILNGSKEVMNLLLAKKIDDTILNHDLDSALHAAISLGSRGLSLIADFIEHPGVDLMVAGQHGHTALHVIALCNNIEALKIIHAKITSNKRASLRKSLHKIPYNLFVKDRNGATAMHIAAKVGSIEVMEFLFQACKNFGCRWRHFTNTSSCDKRVPLHSAVETGQVESVRVLLKHGASSTILRGNHSPPLHTACSLDNLDILKVMVELHGKEVLQSRDVYGGTPLHYSTFSIACEQVISYLIENGVPVNEADSSGLTPLANAIYLGSVAATKALLRYGADPLIKDHLGRNALTLAIQGQRIEVFKSVADSKHLGAMANDCDNEKLCPIHHAFKLGICEVVPTLWNLTHCEKDGHGNNCLHLASMSRNDNTILHLSSYPSSVLMINDPNNEGLTPLHIAARGCTPAVIERFIDLGAVIHKSSFGLTPFMMACSTGNLKAGKLLFRKTQFQKLWVDHSGNTCLHLAVEGRNPEMITFCLDQGVPITLNNDGLSFLDKIIDLGDQNLAEAALHHHRWEECIDVSSLDKPHPLLRIIDRMPEIYGILLDQCYTTATCDPTSYEYWEEISYKVVNIGLQHCNPKKIKKDKVKMDDVMIHLHTEDDFDHDDLDVAVRPVMQPKSLWKWLRNREGAISMAVMQKLIERKQDEYLLHPVVVTYLSSRWNWYTQLVYSINIASHFLLAIFLSIFLALVPLPVQRTNSVASLNSTSVDQNDTCCEDTLGREHQVFLYLTLLFSVINFFWFMFPFVLYRLGSLRGYSYRLHAWINLLAAVSTITFISSILAGGLKAAFWEAGAIGIFCAWFAAGLNLQVVNAGKIGVYITLLISTTAQVIKVFVIMVVFLLSLAFPLNVLLGSQTSLQFTSLDLSIFGTLYSLIAATDFLGIIALEQSGQLQFPILTFLFLVLLIILLPIVIINILIGLAVGDIAEIKKDATITHRTLEVQALAIFPDNTTSQTHRIYPNIYNSFWKRLFHRSLFRSKYRMYNKAKKPISTIVREVLAEKQEEDDKKIKSLAKGIEDLTSLETHQMDAIKNLEGILAKMMEAQGLQK